MIYIYVCSKSIVCNWGQNLRIHICVGSRVIQSIAHASVLIFKKSVYLQDFDLDSKIRADIGRRTAHKIQQVEKELAWEKEKHELGLKKLQNR